MIAAGEVACLGRKIGYGQKEWKRLLEAQHTKDRPGARPTARNTSW